MRVRFILALTFVVGSVCAGCSPCSQGGDEGEGAGEPVAEGEGEGARDPSSLLLPSGVDLLSAPVGGVWVDGDANHDPSCTEVWNGPHGITDGVVDVELIQLTTRGALWRVPSDAHVGDVYTPSVLCAQVRSEGADHHVVSGALPTRTAPRITAATTRQEVIHQQRCNLIFGPPDGQSGYEATDDIRNNFVDVAVTTDAPALLVEQWTLPHGVKLAAQDLPAIGAVDVVNGRAELAVDHDHVDVHVRFVDLPQGIASNTFAVPVDLGCSSTSGSTLATLALALCLSSRRNSRRS